MTASAPNLAVHTMAGANVVELARADMTDAALIKTVGDEIYELVKGADRPRLVVDFQKVQRLSSAALGMLVALDKVVTRQRGQLRVANVGQSIADVFAITGLDQSLTICDSTQDAVDSFN
jgi:anti-sigma B factor antagonist